MPVAHLHPWLGSRLVCPRDKTTLTASDGIVSCRNGHDYSVVDGIPVMLFDDGSPTHGYITRSLEQVRRIRAGEALEDVLWTPKNPDADVDEFVQAEIPYTCGNLYRGLQHKLQRYPFPDPPLPIGEGDFLLDVGCNWGRWTISAARLGYRAIGIDPCLDAVTAAARISRRLGVESAFLVADARHLPFADDSFGVSFSNNVLHHLKKTNSRMALSEMSRVTKEGGLTVVQMANRLGLRCLYKQVLLGFREGKEGADIIYWTPSELKTEFRNMFGETSLSADCYFGLNVQKADIDLMPARFRAVIRASEIAKKLSMKFPAFAQLADSVYLHSTNRKIKAEKVKETAVAAS